jgi:hypothetical protein
MSTLESRWIEMTPAQYAGFLANLKPSLPGRENLRGRGRGEGIGK